MQGGEGWPAEGLQTQRLALRPLLFWVVMFLKEPFHNCCPRPLWARPQFHLISFPCPSEGSKRPHASKGWDTEGLRVDMSGWGLVAQ